MSPRPLLLDLFCGAGGAAVGYHRAGFDILGVDIKRQPRYPFPMVQADALDFLTWARLEGVAAIHASPPCQDYSKAMRHLTSGYPRLIGRIRDLLERIGLPWVIENVEGSPLPRQSDLFGCHGLELCGTMFGLPVWRHRLFELSLATQGAPRGCDHSRSAMNPHNQLGRDRIYAEIGRGDPEKPWRQAMGVDWMTKDEGREAIPPVYTEYIGGMVKAIL